MEHLWTNSELRWLGTPVPVTSLFPTARDRTRRTRPATASTARESHPPHLQSDAVSRAPSFHFSALFPHPAALLFHLLEEGACRTRARVLPCFILAPDAPDELELK